MMQKLALTLFLCLREPSVSAYDQKHRFAKGFRVPMGGSSSGERCPSTREFLGDGHFKTDEAYTYGGSAPRDVSCGKHHDATCVSDLTSGGTYEFECTQCDLIYPSEATRVCTDLSCSTYQCLLPLEPTKDNNTDVTEISRNRNTDAEKVNVCTETTRSDFFTVTELSSSCRLNSAQRMLTKHFTTGVSNVRKVSLLMKQQRESTVEFSDTLENCELFVDNAKCKSYNRFEVHIMPLRLLLALHWILLTPLL